MAVEYKRYERKEDGSIVVLMSRREPGRYVHYDGPAVDQDSGDEFSNGLFYSDAGWLVMESTRLQDGTRSYNVICIYEDEQEALEQCEEWKAIDERERAEDAYWRHVDHMIDVARGK